MRILFTGGGTGGHFFPIIAISRELKRIAEEDRILDVELYYLGPDTSMREALLREEIVSDVIFAGKMRRYFSFATIVDAVKIILGVLQSFWKLFVITPDVIFSKGGFASFPILFVARIYRIPVMIHESDAVPGIVNRWSGKFARRVAVAFPDAVGYFPRERTAVVGNPIRKRLLGGIKEDSKEHLAIFSDKPVVFVVGGSQGAAPLNQMMLEGLPQFLHEFEVIHQTGEGEFPDISKQALVLLTSETKPRYHIFPFLDETRMRESYAACDIVLARAGSMIFEIAAAGRPAVLVPLPHAAQDHQRENAYAYAKAGAAVVVEEANATPNLMLHTLLKLIGNPDIMKQMADAAEKFARVDSAELIAREILSLARTH
jgi:UDP-N-acetylglucosamine--N-acetylmuramyl-(pentapeptide) pyrophosphoryl-undecaprenol N-acetylglucosamine transferase